MRKIYCLFITGITSFNCYSQLSPSFTEAKKDTVKIERDKNADRTIRLKIKIDGVNTAAPNTLTFTLNTAQTSYGICSPFAAQKITVIPGEFEIKSPSITILQGDNGGTTKYIVLQMAYNDGTSNQIKNVVIAITDKEEEKKEDKGADRNRIMLLNAYNFDFGSTSLKSNYVGHLNLFAPSLSNNNRWGFNTGIMKINYGQKDSTNTGGATVSENILLSPFDTIKVGLKYLREINSYKTEKRNTVWSFYVQPTFELTFKKAKQHVYLHAHMELLASKWSATTTGVNLKRDTSVLGTNFNAAVFRSNIASNNTYTINSLSSYFGLGFTFDLTPWNGGSFFFQPTYGITSNTPSLSSVDINTGLPVSYIKGGAQKARTWRSYYLVRANYRHVLSKDATVIIGMDIRGLVPLYSPQYAAYVGLNIGLDSILGLIGGKTKE